VDRARQPAGRVPRQAAGPLRDLRFPEYTPLGRLPADSVAALLAAGTPRLFWPGEIILLEGDTSSHVVVLLRGVVKVTSDNDDGTTMLLNIRVGGEIVGEFAALDGKPRSTTVRAAGQVHAVVVSARDFTRLIDTRPDFARAIAASVTDKARTWVRRRIAMDNRSVQARLAVVILELARQHGVPGADGVEIVPRITQRELADLADRSLAPVERAIKALRDDRVLRTGYARLVILDVPRLEREAATTLGAGGE
jgi:CRP-like cAMP-binding protein